MLLRHTTADVMERSALTINPAKTCQPIGALYAALGVHNCLPHSHGSQGCCAYHRSTLTRHYKEPVMAGSSSFTEGSAVFGGQANLLQAITNMFALYNPEVIAIHTTCLSETIGDDIPQIISKAREEKKIPPGKYVIHANTPSYSGSHVTGFANMVRAMVDYFAGPPDARTTAINLIPGWVEPADMREIKRLAGVLGVRAILFPDTSDVLDAPQTGKHEFYPKGGTTVAALRATAASQATGSQAQFLTNLANQFNQAAQTGTMPSPRGAQSGGQAQEAQGGQSSSSGAHHHHHHGGGGSMSQSSSVQQAFQSAMSILEQATGSTSSTGTSTST